MNELLAEAWRERFLAPGHAINYRYIDEWYCEGVADTPSADARCRIWLRRLYDTHGLQATFALFGPPVAVAAADWVCEQVCGETIETARGLTPRDVEQALALAPAQRYAGILVIDALANALVNLGT